MPSLAVRSEIRLQPHGSLLTSPPLLGTSDSALMRDKAAGGAGAAAEIEAGEESPKIEVGIFTHVGDPAVHANEDRATAVLDLLGKFPPVDKT